jgi:hypothetical protein
MNNKKRIISIITFLVTAVLLFNYKAFLRWQLEKHISGIQFKDVSLNTSGIILHSVNVDKGWIKGSLDTLTSDFTGQHLLIEGGNLSANLDEYNKQKEEPSKQKRNIQFHGITLKIAYKNYQAVLQKVRSSGNQICFSEAKLENPALSAIDGCLQKESKIANIETVKLEDLSFMGVQAKDLTAHKVKINLNEKLAELQLVKTQIVVEKQTLAIEASNVIASKKSKLVHSDLVKVMHPWLASDWTAFKNVEIQHTDKWTVSVGSSHVQIDPNTLTFSGSEDCSTWIDSLPNNLKNNPLDKARFSGKVSFSVGLRPKLIFNLKADCKATCSTLPSLRETFRYTAYTPKREPFERESGPISKEWVPIGLMGDMPLATTTMEDPGFEHHKGFINQAFVNSFNDNLKEGKFIRGGSTITMQLVKNIWLNRDKTLGRKVQEFFLSQALESCYSKKDILELYLNVVEFGPNKYGVAAGAQHWFKKQPSDLTSSEAFWMASILPKPSLTSPPNELALKRIEGLMKKLGVDVIDDSEDTQLEDLNR